MRLLKVIIFLVVLISFLPLDGLCSDDHHETTEHHHGIVICPTHCCGAILTSSSVANLPEVSSSFSFAYELTYEDPILPTEVKPPKHHS